MVKTVQVSFKTVLGCLIKWALLLSPIVAPRVVRACLLLACLFAVRCCCSLFVQMQYVRTYMHSPTKTNQSYRHMRAYPAVLLAHVMECSGTSHPNS